MATNRNSAALSTSLISLDNSTFPPPPKPPRRSLNNHGYSRNHSRGREGEEGGEDGGDRLLCSLQRHTATLPYFSTYSHCMPDSSSSYTSSNTYTPPSLPVIRIYGKTRLPFAAGVRRRRLQQEDDNDVAHHRIVNTVLHIHGVFPYCYIEYDDSGGRQSLDKVDHFIAALTSDINRVLQLGVRADMQADVGQRRRHGILEGESDLEEESNHRPYNNFKTAIVAMLLVKAIPYYGFHAKYKYFIKISFTSPFLMKSAATLLTKSTTILGRMWKVYESHLPYHLQFFIDYNLYGMADIRYNKGYIRKPVVHLQHDQHHQQKFGALAGNSNHSNTDSFNKLTTIYNMLTSPPAPPPPPPPPHPPPTSSSSSDHPPAPLSTSNISSSSSDSSSSNYFSPSPIPPHSWNCLEIDVWADDILNRLDIVERPRQALMFGGISTSDSSISGGGGGGGGGSGSTSRTSTTASSDSSSSASSSGGADTRQLVSSLKALWEDEQRRRGGEFPVNRSTQAGERDPQPLMEPHIEENFRKQIAYFVTEYEQALQQKDDDVSISQQKEEVKVVDDRQQPEVQYSTNNNNSNESYNKYHHSNTASSVPHTNSSFSSSSGAHPPPPPALPPETPRPVTNALLQKRLPKPPSILPILDQVLDMDSPTVMTAFNSITALLPSRIEAAIQQYPTSFGLEVADTQDTQRTVATTTNTTTSVTVDANVGKEGVLVDAANPDIISSPSLSSSSSQLVLVERWKINHSSQLAASDEKTSILSQGDLETLEILRELRQLGTQELIDGARSDGEDDIEKDLMNEEVDISYLRKRRKHVDGMYELDEEHEEMEKDDNNNDNDQEDLLIDVFEEDEEQETLILEEMFLGSQAPVLITPDKKRHQSNQRTPLQFTTTSSQVSPSSPSKPSSSSSSASSPSASAHKNRKRKQEVVASNQLLTSPPQAPTSSLDFVFEEDDIEDDDDNLRFSPSRKRGRFNNIPQTDGADDDNDAEEHLITIPHKQAQLRSASPPPESNFPSTRLRHLTSSIQELWSPRQDLDGGGESFSNSGNFIRFTADMIGLGRDDYHEEEGSQFFHVNLSLPLTARPQVDKGETAVIPLPAKSSTKSTTSTLALPISHAPIGGDESDLDIPDLIISSSTDLLTRAASQLKSSVKTISSSSSASGHLQQQNHSPYSPFTSTNASSKFTSSNFASSSSSSSSISNNFENHNSSSFFIYTPTPPSSLYLETTASPQVIYQPPFFSKRVDYEGFEAKQYGNKRFTIPLDHVKSYPKADGNVYLGMDHWKRVLNWKPLTISASIGSSTLTRKSLWELARPPPCLKQVLDWLAAEGVDERKKIPATKLPPAQQYSTSTRNKQTSTVTSKSQLKLPTQLNTQGWKYSPIRSEKISVTKSNLVIMSVEVHVATRHHLQPDPDKDAILALVYCIKMDEESSRSTFAATDGEFSLVENGMREGFHVGAIVVDSPSLTSVNNPSFTFLGLKNKCKFLQVSSERALLLKLVDLVRIHDPDLLIGYEIHKASWGYVIERASRSPSLGMKNMAQQLSRMKEGVHVTTSRDQDLTGYYYKNQSIYRTSGRIFLNVWKEMKSEYNLLSYTLENVVFHVLHERIPRFSFKTLTDWYPGAGPTTAAAVAATGRPVENRRWKTLAYYIHRVQFTLCLIDEDTGYLNQVSEFARVYGTDLYSVITRGSQHKVEAVMIRIARPENFLLLSPSREDVRLMRAPVAQPLVMEPKSAFYTSPVIVLDFQSLYPSVMIAYNYCFSTCVGRIVSLDKPSYRFGVVPDFQVPMDVIKALEEYFIVSPNGLVFVHPSVRRGAITRMVGELLDTRVMVKDSMKRYREDKSLGKLLDARQLGLKLLANTTYGYVGSNFSGRMPCCEIGDAIVLTGRVILANTINLINSNKSWGAAVVYGDTDSVFIHVPGASKERAFEVGREIVNAVTLANPVPVKLKFEKVYLNCVLVSKKRYVGFKYESLTDQEPVFEAKGIETVRRDGCPATQKLLENSLKILFRSQDLSELKAYLYGEWHKILLGQVSLADFIIAKEVRMCTYKSEKTMPVGAKIATKLAGEDHRAETEYKERVPYVIAYNGDGSSKLKDMAVTPQQFFSDGMRLNGDYYITHKIIPPLNRIFKLVGLDLRVWYRDMPRTVKVTSRQLGRSVPTLNSAASSTASTTTTLERFYSIAHCIVCHLQINYPKKKSSSLCEDCARNTGGSTTFQLAARRAALEHAYLDCVRVCQSCMGNSSSRLDERVDCNSLDCNMLYKRITAKRKVDDEAAAAADKHMLITW